MDVVLLSRNEESHKKKLITASIWSIPFFFLFPPSSTDANHPKRIQNGWQQFNLQDMHQAYTCIILAVLLLANPSPFGCIMVLSAFLSAISGTFNSLSKVLFIFPSRYLFAIGLAPISSFMWSLPHILRSTPNERDSTKVHRTWKHRRASYGTLTLSDVLFQETSPRAFTGNTSQDYNSETQKHFRFSLWAAPCSFAITKGIIVIFFSTT